MFRVYRTIVELRILYNIINFKQHYKALEITHNSYINVYIQHKYLITRAKEKLLKILFKKSSTT